LERSTTIAQADFNEVAAATTAYEPVIHDMVEFDHVVTILPKLRLQCVLT